MHILVICILGLCASSGLAQLPDLVINRPRLAASVELQTVTFPAADCSVVEGCVGEGTRKLLKFDVGFQNVGNADLVIGDPNARPDLFEASSCHGHFHMSGTASYELLNGSGTSVLRARKQGWCFRDNVAFHPAAGPGKFDCEHQGISAGWEDIYDKSLDCQWLDVTGVPGGNYILRVVANPQRVFQEANYGNNAVSVQITLAGAPPVVNPPVGGTQPPKVQPKAQPKPKVKAAPKKKVENPWKKMRDKFKKKKPVKPKAKVKPKGHGHGHGHGHDD